mgnify:CR=1 FL=1
MREKGLNIFQIKWIALILMVIDHMGSFLFPEIHVFRWIGRLSAPLFLFCLVQGIGHTGDKKKYLLRLYGFAVGTELLWILCDVCGLTVYGHTNIFGTFFVIAAVIFVIKRFRWYISVGILLLWQAVSIVLVLIMDVMNGIPETVQYLVVTATGNASLCDYGPLWVVMGVLMYHWRDDKKQVTIGYTGCCIALWILSVTAPFARVALWAEYYVPAFGGAANFCCVLLTGTNAIETMMGRAGLYFGDYQWLMIFSLPIMLFYNGKRGKSWKYFFYVFYPAHLVLLTVLTQVL